MIQLNDYLKLDLLKIGLLKICSPLKDKKIIEKGSRSQKHLKNKHFYEYIYKKITIL